MTFSGAVAYETANETNHQGRLIKSFGAPFPAGTIFVDNAPTGSQNWGILKFEGYDLNPIVFSVIWT